MLLLLWLYYLSFILLLFFSALLCDSVTTATENINTSTLNKISSILLSSTDDDKTTTATTTTQQSILAHSQKQQQQQQKQGDGRIPEMKRRRRISIECMSPSLLECKKENNKSNNNNNNNNECYKNIINEQNYVLHKLRLKYNRSNNNVQFIQRTYKLLNTIFVTIIDNNNDNDNDNKIIDQYILSINGVKNVYPSENFQLLDTITTTNNKSNSNNNNNNNNAEQEEDDNDNDDNEYSTPLKQIGVDIAANTYCATGLGITIAVLDGGVDYTHKALDGPGTIDAFNNAYGYNITDIKNKQRESYFPTSRIIDGYDFLGDTYMDGDFQLYAKPDDDPIDSPIAGHGTAVTHVIRSVAPDATIIAIKICTTTGNTCPDFAVIAALEYILDIDDVTVDIVNLSLGRLYTSSYYSVLARATEEVFAYGILPVLAAGNSGNYPFILGGAPATPNSLTVGATATFSFNTEQTLPIVMAGYTSRGPGTYNMIKPDVIAPGGPYRLAQAGTGNRYKTYQGTSFSAPMVAGAAALIKQYCTSCSPFVIKTILMNHANHIDIQYNLDNKNDDNDIITTPIGDSTISSTNIKNINTNIAPVTIQGNGEIRIHRALAATFYSYSLDDMNPSISLGLINAANDIILKRRIRIVQINNNSNNDSIIIECTYQLRSQQHENAIQITFTPSIINLTSNNNNNNDCQDDDEIINEHFVDIEFTIIAANAPSNHMNSGGTTGRNPDTLDYNEIDGWIHLTKKNKNNNDDNDDSSNNDNEQVGLPFHMIVRKAADVTIETNKYDSEVLNKLPTTLPVNIHNKGAEIATIDTYQLLFTSTDDPELGYGLTNPPADIRSVGYRILPVNDDNNNNNCNYLIEFAIQTWESQLSLSYTHFNIWFDLNFDEKAEYYIYNTGYRLGDFESHIRIVNITQGTEQCVGYPPDHATNTANTIMRVCSNHIGITDDDITEVNVAISSYSFPQETISDLVGYTKITIPKATLSAPSYDIYPNSTLKVIEIDGIDTDDDNDNNVLTPLGLMLVTNSYRSATHTGGATRDTETILITRNGFSPPREISPDVLNFPLATDIIGPTTCSSSWSNAKTQCNNNNSRRKLNDDANKLSGRVPLKVDTSVSNDTILYATTIRDERYRILQGSNLKCPELVVPRSNATIVKNDDEMINNNNNALTEPTKSPVAFIVPTTNIRIDNINSQPPQEKDEDGIDDDPSNTAPPLSINERPTFSNAAAAPSAFWISNNNNNICLFLFFVVAAIPWL